MYQSQHARLTKLLIRKGNQKFNHLQIGRYSPQTKVDQNLDEFDQMLLDIIDKVFKYSLGEENEKIVFERARYIAIDLTKKQIEGSPSLDSDKHVSRQFEELYYTYYGWPMYWYGPYMWGLSKPVFGFAEKL